MKIDLAVALSLSCSRIMTGDSKVVQLLHNHMSSRFDLFISKLDSTYFLRCLKNKQHSYHIPLNSGKKISFMQILTITKKGLISHQNLMFFCKIIHIFQNMYCDDSKMSANTTNLSRLLTSSIAEAKAMG